ncbi:MAG TPA: class I SAM-dependent methyltransferase [Luteimonas sp.]|nr:class I SAM-dependent methyltransferase [Luteimonas sp.]
MAERALPEFGSENLDHCVLCGRTGRQDLRWSRLLALQPPYAALACPDCGLRWLSPRPDSAGYLKLYSDENYFGGRGAAPEDYATLAKARRPYFATRIESIERHFSPGKLAMLDYGAATGEFVALARERGHACDGVELSDDARAVALSRHGIDLLPADAATAMSEAVYDVVHMNHVLEHMPDPLAQLRWCAKVLKPGGLLVAEVPQQFDNDLDKARRAIGIGGRQSRFDAYSLHHTFFFTPRSMRTLAEKAGFSPVRIATFNPAKTPLWPFSLRNWILRPWLGAADKIRSGGNIVELYAAKMP